MSRAAEELHLTPSAISHALRELERDLGFALTERSKRGVRLTRAGERYAEEVRKALAILSKARDCAREERLEGRFTLSVSPGLAMFWLLRHIRDFSAVCPGVEIIITTPEEFEVVDDPEVDLFIAYGSGSWRGYQAEFLTHLQLAPYCSPALLAERGGMPGPADVARFPLLHLRDHGDWARWLAAAGEDSGLAHRGMVMSNMSLVMAAAIDGLGVAMGDHISCRTAVEAGQLVQPLGLSIRSPEGYYLVASPEKRHHPVARALRDWVRHRLRQ